MADETTAKKQLVTVTWEEDGSQFVTFDATTNENHEDSVEITDHPVEAGTDITDHIRSIPSVLSLSAVVTDTPFLRNGETEPEPASTGGEANRRAISAHEFLRKTMDQGKLVVVFTKLRTYPGMAINSISVTRNKDTSKKVDLEIALRQVIIAVTEQVDAPEPAAPTRRRKARQGKKSKKKETDANKTKARKTSVAQKGLSALGINI